MVTIFMTLCEGKAPMVTIFMTFCEGKASMVTIFMTLCEGKASIVTIFATGAAAETDADDGNELLDSLPYILTG